jgi:hypothetical protein
MVQPDHLSGRLALGTQVGASIGVNGGESEEAGGRKEFRCGRDPE